MLRERRGVNFDDLSVEEQKELFEESVRESRDEASRALRSSLNRIMYSSTAEEVLKMVKEDENGVLNQLPDDPEISLTLSVDDIDEAEKVGVDVRLEIAVSKICDIYAGVMDGIYEKENLEDLCDDLDGANDLLAMTDIISSIYDYVEERGEVELDGFKEEFSSFAIGDKADVNLESGTPEDILKTLEKEKLVKVKRGKVRATKARG